MKVKRTNVFLFWQQTEKSECIHLVAHVKMHIESNFQVNRMKISRDIRKHVLMNIFGMLFFDEKIGF